MSDLHHELRIVVRSLHRGGVPTLVAVITLAVGLVGATSLFVVAESALFAAPLPTDEPSRVVALSRTSEEVHDGPLPILHFFDWSEQNRTLESLGAYSEELQFNLSGSPPERILASAVSSGLFRVLGVQPQLGRSFGNDADAPGSERLVLLSHRFWQRRFGGDREALGRTILLDGAAWRVAGVMPEGFRFPSPAVDLWLPLGSQPRALGWHSRSVASVYAVGRLPEGVEPSAVEKDLDRITAGIEEVTGISPQPSPLVTTLEEKLLGPVSRLLGLLGFAVFVVLGIACANVGHLLLARGLERRGELATRIALGAGRWQIVRLLLLESVVLALAAFLLALLFTPAFAGLLLDMLPSSYAAVEAPVWNLRGLFSATVLATAAGLAFGIVPAWSVSTVNPARTLRPGRGSSAGTRGRSLLVVVEVAVAVTLLVGAGLSLRTLDSLLGVDPGFDPRDLLSMRVDPLAQNLPELSDWIRFAEDLERLTGNLPGVEASTVSLALPLQAGVQPISRAGRPDMPIRPDVLPLVLAQPVSPSYFDVLAVSLLEGRTFSKTDDLDRPLVAVVDRGLAEMLWPGESPIGRRVAFEYALPPGGYSPDAEIVPTWREVIGVVETVRYESLRDLPRGQVYAPLAQPPVYMHRQRPALALTLSTTTQPLAQVPMVRDAISRFDPTLPVFEIGTLDDRITEHLAEEHLLARQLTTFAVLALLLAAAGIYAAFAQLVTRRTREIGLRMALGATRTGLVRRLLGNAVRLALWGIVLGSLAGLALARWVESRLHGIETFDPLTFSVAAVSILLVALAASFLPARRASRLEPRECLRYE